MCGERPRPSLARIKKVSKPGFVTLMFRYNRIPRLPPVHTFDSQRNIRVSPRGATSAHAAAPQLASRLQGAAHRVLPSGGMGGAL